MSKRCISFTKCHSIEDVESIADDIRKSDGTIIFSSPEYEYGLCVFIVEATNHKEFLQRFEGTLSFNKIDVYE